MRIQREDTPMNLLGTYKHFLKARCQTTCIRILASTRTRQHQSKEQSYDESVHEFESVYIQQKRGNRLSNIP